MVSSETQKRRILVVDDVEGVRTAVSLALAQSGFEVEEASTACEALKQHRKDSFSIVLTDIVMPDGDGFELIKAIRKETPQTYIIAMSGGGPMNMETCLKIASHLGAHFILEKPFSTSDLLEAIRKATALPKA